MIYDILMTNLTNDGSTHYFNGNLQVQLWTCGMTKKIQVRCVGCMENALLRLFIRPTGAAINPRFDIELGRLFKLCLRVHDISIQYDADESFGGFRKP